MKPKPTTQAILKWLNSQSVMDQLNQFKQTNPNYEFSETSIDEAFTLFDLNKSLLLQAIEKNILDEQISFTKRQQIHNTLKNLVTQLSQIAQPSFKFNATHPNAAAFAQAIITGINNLTDIVDSAKLQERLKGFADYSTETKELSKIKTKYNALVKEIENAFKLNNESKELHNNLKLTADNLSKAIKDLETEKTKTEKIKTDIDLVSQSINKSKQEIEDKKVKISSFHKNIEDYQKSISQLETDAKAIIAKEEEINNLISQAETALQLKSAEGISAAFSSQLIIASKNNTLRWWMVGAVTFIISALLLTIWIVSGKWIEHPDAISSIIGRVVAVAISITGATFCAKQYVKQKNIIEDYAYKSVLSKSIVAFTEEIKKRDGTKVADYLTQVLSEIHKDPLRARDNIEDKNIGLDAPELVNKLIDILSKNVK
jgi:uncharacterized coiled-coil DUF342 family protein